MDKIRKNFQQSILNINKSNNRLDLSREELIIKRLETKLGKSKEEINYMINADLLSVMAIVQAHQK